MDTDQSVQPRSALKRADLSQVCFERVITSLVLAGVLLAMPWLDRSKTVPIAIVAVAVQVLTSLIFKNRFESDRSRLGAFMVVDHLVAGSIVLVIPELFVPVVLIHTYSVGVNAAYLNARWLRSAMFVVTLITGAAYFRVEFNTWLAVFAVMTILFVHSLINRSGAVHEALHRVEMVETLQAELERSSSKLEWQANHDELTELDNRRSFLDHLSSSITQTPDSVGVAILDIDGFKEINDTYGHIAGDQVLQTVGARLQATCEGVLIARLGGDEFAIVSTGDRAQLQELGELVVREIRQPIQLDRGVVKVGSSVGLAHTSSCESTELMTVADSAMYKAKRSGGGVAWGSPEDPHQGRELPSAQMLGLPPAPIKEQTNIVG